MIIAFQGITAQSWNEQTGTNFYEGLSYPEAIKRFEYIKNKDVKTKRKLAEAYYYTGNYEKSESYYAQVANSSEHSLQDIYDYASVLAVNKKYDEAKIQNERFAKESGRGTASVARTASQNFYQSFFKKNDDVVLKNLSLNTEHADFGAAYSGEYLVFTSSNRVDLAKDWRMNDLPYVDLKFSKTDTSLELKSPEKLIKTYDSKYHRGPATFDASGSTMVFTENIPDTKNTDILRLKLLETRKQGNDWSQPTEFPFNKPDEYSVGHATLSADGTVLIFASDKPGGFGKTDLYLSVKQNDTWTEPVNLGSKINTDGKEMFPYLHTNGDLFFASDGHPGLGGLDLYMIKLKGTQTIGNIMYLDEPFNSNLDDFAFILNQDGQSGYFSSNRTGGKGNDDIYAFRIPQPIPPIFVAGTVLDEENQVLPGTDVYLTEKKSVNGDTSMTDCESFYAFEIQRDKTYLLRATTPFYYDAEIEFKAENVRDTLFKNLVLRKIPSASFQISVFDKKTGTALSDVAIIITDIVTGENFTHTTSADGTYEIPLIKSVKEFMNFKISVQKQGYLNKEFAYEQEITDYKRYEFKAEIYQPELDVDIVEMEDVTIYYDYRKWNIREDAEPELDKIVNLMKTNPELRLELSSHTDCRGSNEKNLDLSQKRAESATLYIKSKISNPDRITGKGYGETKPINSCDCDVAHPCTEEDYQKNRRTEIHIVTK